MVLGLKRLVGLHGREARTGFSNMGQVAMPKDVGMGIALGELLKQCIEGSLLSRSTGVGRATFLVQASFVSYAQRATVVASGLAATDGLGKQRGDVAITGYQ